MKQVQSIVSSLSAFAGRAQVRPGHAGDRLARDGHGSPGGASRFAHAGEEPSLEEVLQDPVVWQRARADGLELADIQRVLVAAQQR